MERAICVVFAFFQLIAANAANATNYRTAIYKAFVTNNMAMWKNTIDEMGSKANNSSDYLLELVNYQYGYVAWSIGNKKTADAKRYLEAAESNLALYEATNTCPSMVQSYKSAFYGFRIGLAIWQAPFLGPKSLEYAQQAIKQNTNNPFGYIQLANGWFYMPEAFGGSKKLALNYYKKAEKLLEKNKKNGQYDWNYLNILVVIAQAHTKLEQYESAKLYYEKILAIEPQFTWVKNELYPQLLKKIN